MERTSAPIIGIAVIIAVAAAIYAYTMRGELLLQKAAVAAAEKKLADFNRTAEDARRKSAVAAASLDTCNTALADAHAKLDAMAKPPVRARRPAAAPP
jgi:hypothetical protein